MRMNSCLLNVAKGNLLTSVNMNRAIKPANNNKKNVDPKPKTTQNQFPLAIIFHILFHHSSVVAMSISNVRSEMTNQLFKICTR